MSDLTTETEAYLEQRLAALARESDTLQLRLDLLEQERLAIEAELWRRVVAATAQAPSP